MQNILGKGGSKLGMVAHSVILEVWSVGPIR